MLKHLSGGSVDDLLHLFALLRAVIFDGALHEAIEASLGAEGGNLVESVLDDPGGDQAAEHHPDDEGQRNQGSRLDPVLPARPR
jgi:hypothetical protein